MSGNDSRPDLARGVARRRFGQPTVCPPENQCTRVEKIPRSCPTGMQSSESESEAKVDGAGKGLFRDQCDQ